MVRVRSEGFPHEHLNRTRQLPIARRSHAIEDQWGWCDLPIRLTDTFSRHKDPFGVYYEPMSPTAYELQVMMVWGSWKAMIGMRAEEYVVDGLGVRVALALALENPT